MINERVAALNQEFKDKLLSGDQNMVKTAGLAGTEFFRTRIRENAVYRKLLPPKAVTADNFDVLEDTDFPAIIVELDINSAGASQVNFETGPTGATFAGRKARCEFGRIMTRKYEIDKIRLTGFKMPVLEVLYDLMLKDIMDVEDEAWAALNNMIVGEADDQKAQYKEFGVRRAVKQPWSREGLGNIKDGMTMTAGKLRAAKGLMNELRYSKLIQFDRQEVGGDMAQDMLIDGTTVSKLNGLDLVVTSKTEVCAANDLWIFAEPQFYGANFTYEDVSMVTDEQDGIFLTFFAHETIGGLVTNRAGVSKVTFTDDGTKTDWDAATE